MAIGATLFFVIVTIGPITGGSLNPARTLGPSLVGGNFFYRGWWIYQIAPYVGAVLAGLLYKAVYVLGDVQYEKAVRMIEEEVDGVE